MHVYCMHTPLHFRYKMRRPSGLKRSESYTAPWWHHRLQAMGLYFKRTPWVFILDILKSICHSRPSFYTQCFLDKFLGVTVFLGGAWVIILSKLPGAVLGRSIWSQACILCRDWVKHMFSERARGCHLKYPIQGKDRLIGDIIELQPKFSLMQSSFRDS